MQKRLALKLMQKAGLDPTADCGFPEIAKMQEVLGPLYQVLYLLHFANYYLAFFLLFILIV